MTADHFSPAERAQFDAQTAATKAVCDWLDGDEHRALINCTPAMISQVAVDAYRKALAANPPVERWGDEHQARTTPGGTVIYDDDDDLFTVKAGPNEWVTYSRDRLPFADPLRDRDIDGDRDDQIVGKLDQ